MVKLPSFFHWLKQRTEVSGRDEVKNFRDNKKHLPQPSLSTLSPNYSACRKQVEMEISKTKECRKSSYP